MTNFINFIEIVNRISTIYLREWKKLEETEIFWMEVHAIIFLTTPQIFEEEEVNKFDRLPIPSPVFWRRLNTQTHQIC